MCAAIAFAWCEGDNEREGIVMKRLERQVRRALYWAGEHKKAGDMAGVEAAMSRYRKAQRALNAFMAASFCQHIDLTGVLA